ncbi:hypothetical protein F2P81_018934 [Scophthalmus maximus]|uniref:Uncharacterized protein n=1 Tax=Scophthalmus maximus TaxID=52904 RepID=A0A6A4SB31_SCOMX|nr:hypothetical protein F2P81_018934 [Scophthalmus maximus]
MSVSGRAPSPGFQTSDGSVRRRGEGRSQKHESFKIKIPLPEHELNGVSSAGIGERKSIILESNRRRGGNRQTGERETERGRSEAGHDLQSEIKPGSVCSTRSRRRRPYADICRRSPERRRLIMHERELRDPRRQRCRINTKLSLHSVFGREEEEKLFLFKATRRLRPERIPVTSNI